MVQAITCYKDGEWLMKIRKEDFLNEDLALEDLETISYSIKLLSEAFKNIREWNKGRGGPYAKRKQS